MYIPMIPDCGYKIPMIMIVGVELPHTIPIVGNHSHGYDCGYKSPTITIVGVELPHTITIVGNHSHGCDQGTKVLWLWL